MENKANDPTIRLLYRPQIKKKKFLSEKILFIVNIVLASVVFFAELIVGYRYNSLTLVSDSFHMFCDIASLVIALVAIHKTLSDRTIENEDNSSYTYGYERFKIMGSLANGLLLCAFSLDIIIQSLQKLVEKTPISEPKYVLIVGILGMVSNFVCLLFFHG